MSFVCKEYYPKYLVNVNDTSTWIQTYMV